MKRGFVQKGVIIMALLFFSAKIYGQARSSVGIAYGINKPFSNDYYQGKGFRLQGAIALTNSWAVCR